jgi:hypothetical protein
MRAGSWRTPEKRPATTAFSAPRGIRAEPASVTGTATRFAGTTFGLGETASNPLNEAGVFTATSDVLPANEFPQFRSQVSSRYSGAAPGPTDPLVGDSYAGAPHADDSYMRPARTVDLTAVPAADTPHLGFAISYDTEPGFDNVIVEAHTVGQDDWTTLPESGGRTDAAVPDLREEGFLIDEHPFRRADRRRPGDRIGVRKRARRLVDSGAPAGSLPNTGDLKIDPPTVGASVTTRDTVMLGFGVEQITDPTERATVLGDALRYLGVRARR